MDTDHMKLRPLDPVVANSARHLAREIQSTSYMLIGVLHEGGDMAAALLSVKERLEALADEANTAAEEAFLIEQGRAGVG